MEVAANAVLILISYNRKLYMDIKRAITENKKIRIIAYSVSDQVEKRIQYVLKEILDMYNCPALLPPLYTCVKELIVNAVKANFKYIFFEGYAPENDAEKFISYETALEVFKLEMNREEAKYLAAIARRNNIKSDILFELCGNELDIKITNPVTMTEIEKLNVKRKLIDAAQCDDISDYFLKNIDEQNSEGAGLGLVLVTIMLKNMGVPEKGFSIVSESAKTIASLRVPLTEETLVQFLKQSD